MVVEIATPIAVFESICWVLYLQYLIVRSDVETDRVGKQNIVPPGDFYWYSEGYLYLFPLRLSFAALRAAATHFPASPWRLKPIYNTLYIVVTI